MQTQIYLQSIDNPLPLRKYISMKVRETLGKSRWNVEWVEVRLRDLNGPRGGADKECKITLQGRLCGKLVATTRHSGAGRAFYYALHKILRSLKQSNKQVVSTKRRRRETIRDYKMAS